MGTAVVFGSFWLFTLSVAALTWFLTRDSDVQSDEGYFLAGRSLTSVYIAGSLLLTNLSTEQLVGLNAGAFRDGLSVMCWEVVAGISLVILAIFFLPRYLRSGITTIPQFLEMRYGKAVRAVTAAIFILAYMLILLPFVLFLGANGLNGMLGLHQRFGLSELNMIWILLVLIATLGGAYAVLGGLRAIAVSDTFNGAGLLIGGLMITFLSLQFIGGDDGWLSAFSKIHEADADAFQSLGTSDEKTYWPTLFTGVFLLNFFYWTTNQQIIQRTFGAKSLAEGQKGVLLAAFFKILAPLVLVLPGIAAAYLVITLQDEQMVEAIGRNKDGAWNTNRAYGALVARVLPEWLIGFFAAVVMGSILSTYNSVLNAAATLFSLDVYKAHLKPSASGAEVRRAGQLCSCIVAVLAVVAAPFAFYGREEVFSFFQELNGVYFIPLAAVILVGLFNRWVDGSSAMIALAAGLVLMVLGTFFGGGDSGWLVQHFGSPFHYMGEVFVLLVVVQLVLVNLGLRRDKPFEQIDVGAVELTPWRLAPAVGIALVALAVGVYIVLAF